MSVTGEFIILPPGEAIEEHSADDPSSTKYVCPQSQQNAVFSTIGHPDHSLLGGKEQDLRASAFKASEFIWF